MFNATNISSQKANTGAGVKNNQSPWLLFNILQTCRSFDLKDRIPTLEGS